MELEQLALSRVPGSIAAAQFSGVKSVAAKLNTAASGLALGSQLSKMYEAGGIPSINSITNLGAGAQQIAAGLGLPKNLGIPANLGGVAGVLKNVSFLANIVSLFNSDGTKAAGLYEYGVDPYTGYTVDPSWDTETLSGAAHLFYSAQDYKALKALQQKGTILDQKIMDQVISLDRIKLDFVINNIQFSYSDLNQLSPHIGETFTHKFFGRSPVIVSITGNLLDAAASNGKYVMTHLYERLFRVVRTARYKIAPTLAYQGCTVTGPFLSMSISENSGMEDVLGVTIQMLALRMGFSSPLNNGRSKRSVIDFVGSSKLWGSQTMEPDLWGDGKVGAMPKGVGQRPQNINTGAWAKVTDLVNVGNSAQILNNPAQWKGALTKIDANLGIAQKLSDAKAWLSPSGQTLDFNGNVLTTPIVLPGTPK